MKPTKRVKKNKIYWIVGREKNPDSFTVWFRKPKDYEFRQLHSVGMEATPVHITPITPPRKE